MLKSLAGMLVLALVVVLSLGSPALAADVQGKVKAVDQDGKAVTLEDGTKLMIPATAKVDKNALKAGANVKASFEEKDGQKVVTSIQVSQ
jgi:Cu/Ag efflux protein CusF